MRPIRVVPRLPDDLTPEAVVLLDEQLDQRVEKRRVLLVSDDGDREIGGEKCKSLKEEEARQFRIWSGVLELGSSIEPR